MIGEHTLYDSILLNLLRFFFLIHKIWSSQENVLCPLRRMCILIFLGRIFYECLLNLTGWFIVLFKSFVSLLTFCLVVPSISESGILKTPTSIVELYISPFSSISFASCNLRLCC